jgi:PAS domain S-box-containing protein
VAPAATAGVYNVCTMGPVTLRVLVVDDSPNDAELVIEALRAAGFAVEWTRVETADDMASRLAGGGWDLILSDFSLPTFSGPAALALLRRSGVDLPFIMVSGTVSEEDAVDALRAGADDFIVKGRFARLAPAVIRAMEDAEVRRSKRQAEIQREHAFDALRKSERELREAHRLAAIATWRRRADADRGDWSPEIFRFFGREPAAGIPATADLEPVFLPDSWRRLQDALSRALTRGEPYEIELGIVRPDGEQRWGVSRGEPSLDAEGHVVELHGTLQDITDRKRAADALRESEALLRSFFDSGSAMRGVLEVAEDDLVHVSLNHAAAQGIGRRPDEVRMQRASSLGMPPETIALWLGHCRESLRTGRASRFDHLAHTPAGPRLRAVTVAPIVGSARARVAFTSEDVTDLRSLEEQLRQAQKMEAVGRLAGGVAHDFNNLLSVISGYAELLLRQIGEASPPAPRIRGILQAAGRGADLTRRLLTFSRKRAVQERVLDLNAVLAEVEAMVRQVIGPDIEVETRLESGLAPVVGDAGQIEQALLNLAVNARDAMPDGGRLTIETRNVYLDEAYVRAHPGSGVGWHVLMSVSDSGIGMDAETAGRIFEPFFTTKAPGKGTGLGLPMVYGVVQQCGGSIAVDSAPGRGATFRLFLPRAEEVPAPAAALPAPPQRARGSETILLVEDEPALREIVREGLEAEGYSVLAASNGAEAVAFATSLAPAGGPDLVLTDMMMPAMSGAEVSSRIVALNPATRFLFMSGYAEEGLDRLGLASAAFLEKPFTSAELARKVREALDTPRATP